MSDGRGRFLSALRAAVAEGRLLKLTLGRPGGADPTLRNLFVRPVVLKAGPRLEFVWRHETKDVTKNHPPGEALAEIEGLIGKAFLTAHLMTAEQTFHLEGDRLRVRGSGGPAPARVEGSGEPPLPLQSPSAGASGGNLSAPWLQALGVTHPQGHPREGMGPKLRQIRKFAEILQHLVDEAGLAGRPISVADMGCGKGYLTFAASALLGPSARVRGVELRPELVGQANAVAREQGFSPQLEFVAGTIADVPAGPIDVLIALHACDTATDDAIARGIAAGASLLLVAPCCQKELRPQLTPPPVLADALRHGIFQERQAEFVTDALRALLLEWAGYRTRVFEFVSTEHTAKNTMISAVKRPTPPPPTLAPRIRAFAAFYGIRRQALATHLGFDLAAEPGGSPDSPSGTRR